MASRFLAVSTFSPRPRVASVDLLRGLVMILMALDHSRVYFFHSAAAWDATDLTRTTPALFLTRWVGHFCAPAFAFLAGTGAYLSRSRGRTTQELSRFLLTRGLWLIVLDATLMKFLGSFNLDPRHTFLAVLWAIGASMMFLAALVRLPAIVIGAIGVTIIGTHNMLDGIRAESWSDWSWLFILLHERGTIEPFPGLRVWISYPLLPWIGVVACGYAFGAWLTGGASRRRIAMLGLLMAGLFVVLRAVNLYGDPEPWSRQSTPLFTMLSFLNCEKYPPSLLYLLMTLGPALMIMPELESIPQKVQQVLTLFGRVPLFYYVVHIGFIHGLAATVALIRWFLFYSETGQKMPAGFGLLVAYLVWVLAVLCMYPLCRWFADLKRRRRDWWMGYL